MKQFLKNKSKVKLVAISVIACLCINRSHAQGNLLITPKRVVFEGGKRSEELNLANTGKDTATYVISFIQIRMKDNGAFENITVPDSAQFFADKNIRFFPRSVTLAPNEAQSVKVQVVNVSDLKPGEYRSHLYFRGTPPPRPLGDNDIVSADTTSLSVRLSPIFGISMPVIIRTGETKSDVKISDVVFKLENDTIPVLQMTFNRNGNISVYGDVRVDYISATGAVTRVGYVRGLSVYTPNKIRHFQIPLEINKKINYHSGKLKITYNDQSIKPVMLAQEEIILN